MTTNNPRREKYLTYVASCNEISYKLQRFALKKAEEHEKDIPVQVIHLLFRTQISYAEAVSILCDNHKYFETFPLLRRMNETATLILHFTRNTNEVKRWQVWNMEGQPFFRSKEGYCKWIEKNKLEWTEVSEWKKSAYFSNSWLIHENYGTMQEKGRELYSILSRVSHPTIESAGTNDKPNIHIWNDRTGFAYLMLDISSEKLLKNYIKYLPQDPTEKKEVEKLISSHMEKASEYREIP